LVVLTLRTYDSACQAWNLNDLALNWGCNVGINFKGKAISVSGMRMSVRVGGVSKVLRLGVAGVAVNLITLVVELLDLFHGELLDNSLHTVCDEFPFALIHEVGFSSNDFDIPVDRDDLIDVL
jgi:hypothetical protein